jgi:adenylate cyclase
VTGDPADLARLRHDLHTPLNHIIGYSEMLLEDLGDDDPPGVREDLQAIRAHARQILERVDGLLSRDRIDTGGIDPAALPRELGGPVEAIIAATEGLRARVSGTPDERMAPDLERIASAGHALLVLASGGAIAVGNEPTPVVPAAKGVAASGKREDQAPPRGVILVADDNDANRELLVRRLTREGHQVLVAGDGRTALDTARQERVDLILLDVVMPGMNGYEVLQQLKGDAALRDIPVLMISSLDEMDGVVRCIELGADDYLPKPFNPVLLHARIGACLEKRRLREQEQRHLAELAEWNRRLEERVTQQVAELQRVGRLKRFFSPQVAELILTGGTDDPLQSHRRELTVVFLDLREFTAFAETAAPEDVMAVLNAYHAEMGRVIMAYEGTLEHFAGDGIMVFFNDPVPIENPAERAVRMALAMRERVASLTTEWQKQGYGLAFGIGIAQGFATIGKIGFEDRWEYGAIGTVVNLAHRLCGEAKPGQILVTQKVLALVRPVVEAEPVGDLTLKGFHRPVTAFSVLRVRA